LWLGRRDLFQAVAEELEAEILAAATVGGEVDPWGRLRMAFEKLIDVCAAADVQRIIFVEAPQVVGPAAWRKIELRFAFGALRTILASLIDAKMLKPYPVDLIARSKQDPKIRPQIADLVTGLFDALSVR
jgi:hypothetical protein